jgi:CDP-glycerol glycerophosphotransferase (TagB/SpsB family)
MAFLTDDRLRVLSEQHGLRIGFLPHPNIQPALNRMTLPPHVQALTFADQDVQQLIARSALMVTDYSSMAFNAAYLDRPVVYFQFDADLVNQGAHIGRPGYFDYTEHGFGPVTNTLDHTIAAVTTIIDHGAVPTPTYQHRIETTFTQRDGHCCERTTHAIEQLTPPPPTLFRRIATRLARTPAARAVLAKPHVRRVASSARVRGLIDNN